MNTGKNNCTKSFQGPSTVSTSLQLRTRLVGWCPAGWEPGVAWQWWLAGFTALLCGAGGPLQPNVPQVCWFAETAEPVQSVLLLFCSNSHPMLAQGPLLAEELLLVWLLFCLTAPWAVSLQGPRRVRVPMAVPGDLTYPWCKWAEAWGWKAEKPAAKLAPLYGKTSPWFMEMAPRCFIPAGLSCFGGGSLLSWKGGADVRSECSQTWGEAGRDRRLQLDGAAFQVAQL